MAASAELSLHAGPGSRSGALPPTSLPAVLGALRLLVDSSTAMCHAGRGAASTAVLFLWTVHLAVRLGLEHLHLAQLHWGAVLGMILVAISAFGPNISRLPAILRLPIVILRAAVMFS